MGKSEVQSEKMKAYWAARKAREAEATEVVEAKVETPAFVAEHRKPGGIRGVGSLVETYDAKGAPSKDPNFTTHWERDTPKHMRNRLRKGYRLAKESDVNADHDGYAEPDGAIRKGDLVLVIGSRERLEDEKVVRMRETGLRDKAMAKQLENIPGLEVDPEENYRREQSGKKYFIP